jgi:hypothetical protein
MAELRPYNPTWRDMIANALMGDARPGSARSNIVEGVTGSRGLGTTGMGLVDFTPAGIPMAAQEANRSAMAGDPVGAIANAMAVIPAAKVPIAAAKGAATQGIRAYHGSPHSFDRFDMSKIGTGEGAQAYGHGLYFADNEQVAKAYRDALAPDYWNSKNGNIRNGDIFEQLVKLGRDNGAPLPESETMARTIMQGVEKAGSVQKFANNYELPSEWRKNAPAVQAMSDYLFASSPRPNKGSMYEVNIRANPEQFLDWDKPLGQQSSQVQSVIRELAPQMDNPLRGPAIRNRQAIVAGDGSVPGDVLYNNLGGFRMPAQTSNALREAGIPGIKYLDQGSRGAGDGSRNYVVFDDSLIDIVRKYGLAGLMMGGIGAGAMGGMPQTAPMQSGPPQL